MRLWLGPGDDLVALVRAARAESVVVVIAAGHDPVATARAEAVIGPLAIERAPATRVNAVQPGSAAAARDVRAAIDFLELAQSTTGQILAIS